MASAGSQQLLAQDPAPARRCGTEGRTGHQRREGGNGDGNRGGDEDENGKEHECRDESENRDESGGEREPGNLQSGNRDGLEDARGAATPTSNQQPQPLLIDTTPQRDRYMTINRAQKREARDRIEEGGGEAKKRKKPQESCRRDVRNGGGVGGRRKKRKTRKYGLDRCQPRKCREFKGSRERMSGCWGLILISKRESLSPFSRLIRGFRNKYH